MSHQHHPEDDGGMRIEIDAFHSTSIAEDFGGPAVFAAGVQCPGCNAGSMTVACYDTNSAVLVQMDLTDAEALGLHLLAEVQRLRAAGADTEPVGENGHAVHH